MKKKDLTTETKNDTLNEKVGQPPSRLRLEQLKARGLTQVHLHLPKEAVLVFRRMGKKYKLTQAEIFEQMVRAAMDGKIENVSPLSEIASPAPQNTTER